MLTAMRAAWISSMLGSWTSARLAAHGASGGGPRPVISLTVTGPATGPLRHCGRCRSCVRRRAGWSRAVPRPGRHAATAKDQPQRKRMAGEMRLGTFRGGHAAHSIEVPFAWLAIVPRHHREAAVQRAFDERIAGSGPVAVEAQ